MQDEQIVALYWERNEAAIDETRRKYAAYLTTIAAHILTDREDCRECLNDTYLAAWNSLPPQRPAVLSTYLGKLTRRIAIDRFRRHHRLKRKDSEYALSLEELDECVSGRDSAESTVETKLLAEAIGRFLRTLPAETRHLFVRRYYFLDPLREAATHTGMSESKAKSLLFRTRQDLKAYLIKEGFDV